MTSIELFNLISKPWASANDIKRIASCGRDSAIIIRNKIKSDVIKSGKNLPNSKEILVPMEMVVEYLGLNSAHITEMALNEISMANRK